MPKIKPDANAGKPYNLRCRKCGCLVEKLVSRFSMYGKPAAYAYKCANPFHNCGDMTREFCEPFRSYEEPKAHAVWTDQNTAEEHPGAPEECEHVLCLERHTHRALRSGDRHPGRLVDCPSEECEPPF